MDVMCVGTEAAEGERRVQGGHLNLSWGRPVHVVCVQGTEAAGDGQIQEGHSNLS